MKTTRQLPYAHRRVQLFGRLLRHHRKLFGAKCSRWMGLTQELAGGAAPPDSGITDGLKCYMCELPKQAHLSSQCPKGKHMAYSGSWLHQRGAQQLPCMHVRATDQHSSDAYRTPVCTGSPHGHSLPSRTFPCGPSAPKVFSYATESVMHRDCTFFWASHSLPLLWSITCVRMPHRRTAGSERAGELHQWPMYAAHVCSTGSHAWKSTPQVALSLSAYTHHGITCSHSQHRHCPYHTV